MKIEFDFPDFQGDKRAFPDFWLRKMFGGLPFGGHVGAALASNFVRLLEAAFAEFELAEAYTRRYWTTHSGVDLGAMHRSISHWEACISNLHRAILGFRRLRSTDSVPLGLRQLLANPRPVFAKEEVAERLRSMRDTVHHFEDMLLNGEIPEGSYHSLIANGPETEVHGELGQTLKVIDRVTIGPHEILLADLASWMREMSSYVQKISAFTASAAASRDEPPA